jgi:branched-chain amino acid transport system substrate-binding protein
MVRSGAAVMIGLALLLAGCRALPWPPSASEGSGLSGEIPLGAVWSLTGPGAAFGPQQRDAAILAVQGINGTAFLGGATLRLFTADDRSQPADAVAAFERLIDRDHVVAILGPTLSTSARSADPVAQARGVPVLAVSNTADGIVEIGDFIFRNSPPESQVQPSMIRATREKLGYERVAILYDADDAFTASGYQAFRQALEESGAQILRVETIHGGQADFTRELAAIRALAPDAIVVSALTDDAAAIMRQAREVGLPSRVQFLGGNGFNSPRLIELAGRAAEGAVSGVAWTLNAPTAGNRAFVKTYRQQYGRDPDQFAAQAYAGVHLLATAIRNARSRDPRAIREALAHLRNVDTVLGRFSFDETRNPVQTPLVQIIRDGKAELFP